MLERDLYKNRKYVLSLTKNPTSLYRNVNANDRIPKTASTFELIIKLSRAGKQASFPSESGIFRKTQEPRIKKIKTVCLLASFCPGTPGPGLRAVLYRLI